MVASCAALDCKNNRDKRPDLSYHRIPANKPENKLIRQRWIQNIRREPPLPKDENFFVCSLHFEKSCYERDMQVSIKIYLLFQHVLTFL